MAMQAEAKVVPVSSPLYLSDQYVLHSHDLRLSAAQQEAPFVAPFKGSRR